MVSLAGSAQVAHLSPAAVLTVAVAPAVGLTAMMVRMFAESGRLRLSFAVARRSKADLLTISAYDSVGGLLAVGVIILLGATRPPALIQALNHHPALAFAALGLVGPLLSATFVDRLPLRPILDRTSRAPVPEFDVGGAVMSEGRYRASTRMREQLYAAVEVREGIERDAHRARALRLLMEGCLSWDMIEEDIGRYARHWRRRTPRTLLQALERKKYWPVDVDPGSDTILLIHAATAVGWTRPIEVSCGRAEALRATPPQSPVTRAPVTPESRAADH